MTIVVTGASGGLGTLVSQQLLKTVAPSDLILVTRSPEKLGDMSAAGVEVRRGDFDEPDDLPSAFAGADRMLLISALDTGGRRVPQHKAAIAAAGQAGVGHIAYTSFVGAGPGNPAIVAGDHHATEQALDASGIPNTKLRHQWYAEAIVDNMVTAAVATGKWLSAGFAGGTAPVAKTDCAASAAGVLTERGHEGATYQITGSERITTRALHAFIEELIGRSIEFIETDEQGMFEFFRTMGVQDDYVDGMKNEAFHNWSARDMSTFEMALKHGFLDVLSTDVEKLTGKPARSVLDMARERRDVYLGIAEAAAAGQPS